MTQEELGDKAGISHKFLGSIERGQENPSLEVISRLAKGLEVDVRDLFLLGEEEDGERLKEEIGSLLQEANLQDLQKIVRVLKVFLR